MQFSMLSLPPPREWDVLWLRRLASLDGEQYRHYTTTFRRDVRTLQQQANGAPSERVLAAVRLQLVSSHASERCTSNSMSGKARLFFSKLRHPF